MSSERRYLWIATLVVVVGAVGLLLIPKLREELAPEPHSALVAVEIGGSGVAEVGLVRLSPGTPFSLHAVLVAEGRDGEPFYYTQASALRVEGRDVPAGRLGTWARSGEIAVLWFTVEGFRPFMEVNDESVLEEFRFEESFRPEWGRGWSVTGSLTPRNHALARGFDSKGEIPFGTLRYHVRIEKYFRKGDPAPIARYRSPGAEAVGEAAAQPTMVVAALPGGLYRVSSVFGLPHLEPSGSAAAGVTSELKRWYQTSRSFSRLFVLGGLLDDRGLRWQDLVWEPVEPALEPLLGAVGPGDFLRAGERVVVFWKDAGTPGRLDYGDLCFDLAESAAVRPLNEVFSGGGVLAWADLVDQDGADPDGADPSETPTGESR